MSQDPNLAEASRLLNEALRRTIERYALFYFAQATLTVAAGAVALVLPILAAQAGAQALGWLLIANGLAQALGLVGIRAHPTFLLKLISAALGVLLGTLLIRAAGDPSVLLGALLIVFLTIDGVARLVFALSIRPMRGWWLLALAGLLAILLAFTLWSVWPVASVAWPSVVLGLALVAGGLALGKLVYDLRRDEG
ncbi:MAG: hypothetical protein KatS3mg125_1717 [Lysobacterales bacterium]|nr:MAG: hypothetical protein KatS3mg125_1717 [Xanthomonadales bacterium]